jgi:hypothetical protein
MLLFILQPLLVRKGNLNVHKKVGVAGFVLAAGMIIIGVAVAITGARLNSPTLAVGGLLPKQFLIVPLTDMVLFTTFLGFSLANLKNSDTHKRLMILATLALLPAAFGRIVAMAGISNPLLILLLQEALLIIAVVHDLMTKRKIHPVYKWGGALMVVIHLTRFPIGGSSWWGAVADWLIS